MSQPTSMLGKKSQTSQLRLEVLSGDGLIKSPIRNKYLVETPEERVRQTYLVTLVNEYGYTLDQIDEEVSVIGRGAGQSRADFVIWRTAQDKTNKKPPQIIIECKSDNVTIRAKDYYQGEHYARMVDAPFFVTHNSRETRFWRVRKDKMPGYIEEIENIPHAEASDREIEELIAKLKVFKEDEFANLLHQCHNVIRNRDHLDPAAAFDEIAKILFVKTWVEREMRRKQQRENLFSADWLDTQLGDDPLETLFKQTREAYGRDQIFDREERLNLKPATGREIVRLLERYNLSDTSEDIKGIAFERFLGRTFRGEIGQFFTPRSIVEFMVRMVEPREGDVVCDPASGSGGFLIRFFEIVREQIYSDVDREYRAFGEQLDKLQLSDEEKASRLRAKYDELQVTIDQTRTNSRLWRLANRCIYGCDANDRMARTSKMNMIMHGDGHGGVHHHNGFINVNGIFEGRFDIILTNPPFGANVEPSDRVTPRDVYVPDEQYRHYIEWYGEAYREAQLQVQQAAEDNKPIASLFELPRRGGATNDEKLGKIKTEILFIERCLALLRPGGRLGIVLPEGIFNNPSLAYVREFCEDRAFIKAVVSLPQETFNSAGATVKASLLFVQKFTEEETADFRSKYGAATVEIDDKYQQIIDVETKRLQAEINAARKAKNPSLLKEAQSELRKYERRMAELKSREARQLLKQRFPYPIFLYEAEHVGITGTGQQDTCELYYDEKLGLPEGMKQEDTALELYRRFRQNPEAFILSVASQEVAA